MRPDHVIFSLTVRLTIYLPVFLLLLIGLSGYSGQRTRQVIALVSTVNYSYRLHVMDIHRGISRAVSAVPVSACCLKWSPDGTQIAFNGGSQRVYVTDVYAGETRQLTPTRWQGSIIDWTADGRHLILRNSASGHGDLYRIDADGQNLERLTDNARAALYLPMISPDNQFVLYGAQHEDDADFSLYRLSVKTGASDPLLDEQYPIPQHVAISPDSRYIVLSIIQREELIVVNIDGAEPRRWTPPAYIRELAWSPDSNHILFVFDSGDEAVGVSDFFVTDINGQNRRDLGKKSALGYLSHPAWSPDGAQIVFVSTGPIGESDVYVMDADGGNLRQLTSNPGIEMLPAWQPHP